MRRAFVSTGLAAGLSLLVPAAVPAAPYSPVGWHTMLYPSMRPATVAKVFRAGAASGASPLRVDVPVVQVFPNGRSPDWAALDTYRAAARRYKVDVLGVLYGSPQTPLSCPSANVLICPPSDLTAWRSLVERIVRRAPEIRYWEAWNEPSHAKFFSGSPSDYAEILRATYAAVRRANPAAKVVFGGPPLGEAEIRWTAAVLDGGGRGNFDIASVHFRGRLRSMRAQTRHGLALFRRSGFRGPLWVTETGYPSDPAFQYDPPLLGGPADQARFMRAMVQQILGAGAARVFVTARDSEHRKWGVLTSEGVLTWPALAPKPSYAAISALTRGLRRRCRGRWLKCRRKLQRTDDAARGGQLHAQDARFGRNLARLERRMKM